MNKKFYTSPESSAWLSDDDCAVSGYFNNLGIKNIKAILDMRVFDLMNMNKIDAIRTEEIITCLYKYLNPNFEVDEAMYCGTMSQPFDYSVWRKKHKDLSQVKVADLVLTKDINLYAIQHFYDAIRKKFFKSDEYNWREYRYRDWNDYQQTIKSRKENGNASEV